MSSPGDSSPPPRLPPFTVADRQEAARPLEDNPKPATPSRIEPATAAVSTRNFGVTLRVGTGRDDRVERKIRDDVVRIERSKSLEERVSGASVYVFLNIGKEDDIHTVEPDAVLASASDGTVDIEDLLETDRVFVYAVDQHKALRSDLELVRHPFEITDLVLRAYQPVTGVVLSESGTPIPGAEAWCRSMPEGWSPRCLSQREHTSKAASALDKSRTDELGRFEVLWSGDHSPTVFVKAGGHVTTIRRLDLDKERDTIVTMEASGVIKGRVVDQTGRPVVRAKVHAECPDRAIGKEVWSERRIRRLPFARGRSDGSFRFVDFSPSEVTRLFAVAGQAYAPTVLEPEPEELTGEKEVVLVLKDKPIEQQKRRVAFDLVDAGTRSAIPNDAPIKVRVRSIQTGRVIEYDAPEEPITSGVRRILCDLPQGPLSIEIEVRGFEVQTVELDASAPETIDLEDLEKVAVALELEQS